MGLSAGRESKDGVVWRDGVLRRIRLIILRLDEMDYVKIGLS